MLITTYSTYLLFNQTSRNYPYETSFLLLLTIDERDMVIAVRRSWKWPVGMESPSEIQTDNQVSIWRHLLRRSGPQGGRRDLDSYEEQYRDLKSCKKRIQDALSLARYNTYDRGSSAKWCARTPVTTTSLQAVRRITELSYLRTFNHLEATLNLSTVSDATFDCRNNLGGTSI